MERLSITHGMQIKDARGRTVGVVVACGAAHLLFHQGALRPRRLAVRYEDVASLEGGDVNLKDGAKLLPQEPNVLASQVKQNVLPFQRTLWHASGS